MSHMIPWFGMTRAPVSYDVWARATGHVAAPVGSWGHTIRPVLATSHYWSGHQVSIWARRTGDIIVGGGLPYLSYAFLGLGIAFVESPHDGSRTIRVSCPPTPLIEVPVGQEATVTVTVARSTPATPTHASVVVNGVLVHSGILDPPTGAREVRNPEVAATSGSRVDFWYESTRFDFPWSPDDIDPDWHNWRTTLHPLPPGHTWHVSTQHSVTPVW